MYDKQFTHIPGIFSCQKCGEEVKTMRLWFNTLDLTWQCSKKHMSKVNIAKKKKAHE